MPTKGVYSFVGLFFYIKIYPPHARARIEDIIYLLYFYFLFFVYFFRRKSEFMPIYAEEMPIYTEEIPIYGEEIKDRAMFYFYIALSETILLTFFEGEPPRLK